MIRTAPSFKKNKKNGKMNRSDNRIALDRATRLRLAATMDYLRTNYDDLTPGQKTYFDEMLTLSARAGINSDQVRQLYNMAERHRGNQTLIIRNCY